MWRIARILWPRKAVHGKTFLITGAAGGVGRRIAHRLRNLGANLVLWDINGDQLAILARELDSSIRNRENRKCKLLTAKVDLTSKENIDACVIQTKQAVEKWGGDGGYIYGIINNAGYVSGQELSGLDARSIETTFRVNVLAHFWILQAFLPAMKAVNNGHICTVASAAGYFGTAKMTDYSSSKHAAVGLAESVRMELRHTGYHGIGSTLVCPSHINTDMFRGFKSSWLTPSLSPDDVAEELVDGILCNREIILLPFQLNFLLAVKAMLPTPLTNLLADISGANNSMDTFIGVDNAKTKK